MDRREFLRAGFLSAATAVSLPAEHKQKQLEQIASTGSKKVAISNDHMTWHLQWSKEGLASSALTNKLSGRTFQFSGAKEIELTFSSAKHRVEIPSWSFILGPDDASVPPEQEKGYQLGFHLRAQTDGPWGAAENLLLRNLRGIARKPQDIRYGGYAWFQTSFDLPDDVRGEELVFVLGGYDCQDWNHYWVYVNGTVIGQRASSGRWRTPGQFLLSPEQKEYSSIRFGPGERNLLSIRTRGFDKSFGGLSDELLRKYVFKPVLVDQFISVGMPYVRVSKFEVINVRQPAQNVISLELRGTELPVGVFLYYELAGPTRRKWAEIKNWDTKDLLLLDVKLDDFTLDVSTSEGGAGEPVIAGEELFCCIEHPAGLNQGEDGRVRLIHFPGRSLPINGSVKTHTSLLGVSKAGEGLNQFVSYLQEKSPRKKKFVSVFDPFGINNQWGWCPTLNDLEMLDGLKVLENWKRAGFRFDYYVPDWGWLDNSSDLTRFRPECFPDGPGEVVKRVNDLGMKFGLWFSVSSAAVSCGQYPPVAPSRIPVPGDSSEMSAPKMTYRNGYLTGAGLDGNLCVASEPYFSILRNAILYHIRENNLKLIKLDMGSYYCNSTVHDHLPGKYSVERMFDRLIELADVARKAAPDISVVWYWGARSPFFALHGDFVFESGLFLEGAGTSRFPTLYFRDSVTLNLDMSTQFAKTIPAINKDSLGVWLAENRWGNFMANERWREALVMDLGRGSLLFPQLWGDIYLLGKEDVEFLAEMQALALKNESVFLQRRTNWGDPWENQVYGYAYFQGTHGFVFLNNAHFMARRVKLPLDPSLGLRVGKGTPLELISRFPEKARITRQGGTVHQGGEHVELWLRPFEVLMLEVLPAGSQAKGPSLPPRDSSTPQAPNMGAPLLLEPLNYEDDWMRIVFADAQRFEQEGKKKRVYPFSARLRAVAGKRSILAIAVQLRQGQEEWRYAPSVVEIVQVVARIGDQVLHLIPVPDARQFGNTQSAGGSWVVYKTRYNLQSPLPELRFAVHCYLPEHVVPEIQAWVVNQWWEERTHPLAEGYYADSPS